MNILKRWRKLRARKGVGLAIDVALLLALMLAIHAWQARGLPISEAAPQATMARLGGGTGQATPGTGEVGVVYFFAPWCNVCRSSIGSLDALVEGGSIAWARAIALDYEDQASVEQFVHETGISFPVLLGGQQQVNYWGIRAFPTYFVIDGDGRIASRSVGYSTSLGLRFRAWMAE